MIPDGLPAIVRTVRARWLCRNGRLARTPGARRLRARFRWRRFARISDVDVEAVRVPARRALLPPGRAGAAEALRQRAARHRPRALRLERLAGPRAARTAPRRDAARHRRPPSALALADACGRPPHRSRRDRFASRSHSNWAGHCRRRWCCPAVSRSIASGRSPATPRASRSASSVTCPTCCSPPTRRGRRKRFDRAASSAGDGPAESALGATAAGPRTLAINAANAVIVPSRPRASARRARGPGVRRARPRDPVGVHAEALAGIEGTSALPTTRAVWSAALAAAARRPRSAGRRSRARERVLIGAEWPRASRRAWRHPARQRIR